MKPYRNNMRKQWCCYISTMYCVVSKAHVFLVWRLSCYIAAKKDNSYKCFGAKGSKKILVKIGLVRNIFNLIERWVVCVFASSDLGLGSVAEIELGFTDILTQVYTLMSICIGVHNSWSEGCRLEKNVASNLQWSSMLWDFDVMVR